MTGKKILLIDDEPDAIIFLSTVLEENFYEVHSINNPQFAIEKVLEINPDLICLDIMMPGETGISFYSTLRQNTDIGYIPVIIISGAIESGKFNFRSYISDKSIREPDGFLEKPIKVSEFLNKIEQLLVSTN